MLELKNGHIRLLIEEPKEGYQGPRFDWTGKINQFWWNDISFCGEEKESGSDQMGRGFYNEFGLSDPIGYDQCKNGEYFPKVGVGLLKKYSNDPYDFFYPYEIRPFEFCIKRSENSVSVQCLNKDFESAIYLEKEIVLTRDGFVINYNLENIGNHLIETSEYVHNFLSIKSEGVSSDLHLQFEGGVHFHSFQNGLNPDGSMDIINNSLIWKGTPENDFFFENISRPHEGINWTLIHKKLKVGITEIVDFKPSKINLWGRSNVVSPEIFKAIQLEPGNAQSWKREFRVLTY